MVRKITQKQSVKQNVNVKVHIGNDKMKRRRRAAPAKKEVINPYAQSYNPVYIQSGQAPHLVENNPLLKAIEDLGNKIKISYTEPHRVNSLISSVRNTPQLSTIHSPDNISVLTEEADSFPSILETENIPIRLPRRQTVRKHNYVGHGYWNMGDEPEEEPSPEPQQSQASVFSGINPLVLHHEQAGGRTVYEQIEAGDEQRRGRGRPRNTEEQKEATRERRNARARLAYRERRQALDLLRQGVVPAMYLDRDLQKSP